MAKTNAVRIETINELKEHKPKAYLQEKIGVILTQISNFAFDSTVDLSLKTLTGRKQICKVNKEGLKERPILLTSSHDKKKLKDIQLVMEEEIQANREKVQYHKISAKCVESEHPKKQSDDGFEGSDLLQKKKKRVFIRSRL